MLAQWMLELRLPAGSVCLNVGSSTAHFRHHEQPHVQSLFIEPLEKSGIRFVHCDMKQADGVDEVGDVFDPAFQARLKAYDAAVLVCSNLLEHLTDPAAFARACGSLVRAGGYGVFSVPSSYPYHPDPIDTMLRLKPAELARVLPDWMTIKATEIEAGSYWKDLRASGQLLRRLAHQVARTALPFYRPSHWREVASRLLWLGRPYKVSLALLRKP